MQEFTYQPLKTNESFRLATLHGGQHNDPTSLTVQEYELKTCPPYIALSYEWGYEHEKNISANGTPFRIRTNLHDFLQVLRPEKRSETRLLFIDAICINQADLEERSAQVNLMRDIYEGAESVSAWLGRDSVASDLVADVCQGSSAVDVQSGGGEVPGHSGNTMTLSLQRSAMEVLQRRYWTRMWMMSELMLAKTITLYCGHRSFSWSQLVRILSSQLPAEWYHTSSAIKTFRAVEDVQMSLRTGGQIPVLGLFEDFGRMDCELKQDRVYGLLAFHAHAKNVRCMAADYKGSIEGVYVEALRYCKQIPETTFGTQSGFEIGRCSRAFQSSLDMDSQESISAVFKVMKEHPKSSSLHSPVFRAPLERPRELGKTKTGAWFETGSAFARLTAYCIPVSAHRYTKTHRMLTSNDAREGDQVFRIRGSAIAVVRSISGRIVNLGVMVPKAQEVRRRHANFLCHSLDGSVEVDAAGNAVLSLSCFDVAIFSSLPEAIRP